VTSNSQGKELGHVDENTNKRAKRPATAAPPTCHCRHLFEVHVVEYVDVFAVDQQLRGVATKVSDWDLNGRRVISVTFDHRQRLFDEQHLTLLVLVLLETDNTQWNTHKEIHGFIYGHQEDT